MEAGRIDSRLQKPHFTAHRERGASFSEHGVEETHLGMVNITYNSVEQAQERLLEEEQLQIGWEENV